MKPQEQITLLRDVLTRVLRWPTPAGTIQDYCLPPWLVEEALDAIESTAEQQSSAVPSSYTDWQQQRGAISAYEQWLLDDDYDPYGFLKCLVDRMRERKALYAAHPPAEAPKEPIAVLVPMSILQKLKDLHIRCANKHPHVNGTRDAIWSALEELNTCIKGSKK
jgi:hypothetical protein